jgi:putative FmdB family regulatory protein
MPVYEYICKACDHEFEREQRISDKPVKKCPSCGALKAKRLISRTSFVLKGGGWYSDLYASPSSSGKDDGKKDGGGDGAAASDKSDSGSKEKSGTKEKAAPAGKGGDKGGGKGGKGTKAAA